MKKIIAFSLLCQIPFVLLLAGCGDDARPAVATHSVLKSMKFTSPNNSSGYGIDEIVIDNVHYLVLVESSTSVAMIQKSAPSDLLSITVNPVKSMKFNSNNNSYGVDEIVIDGALYLIVQDSSRAKAILPAPNTVTMPNPER